MTTDVVVTLPPGRPAYGEDALRLLARVESVLAREPTTGAVHGFLALLDDAFRSVAALDEPAGDNPLAAAAKSEAKALEETGLPATAARRLAAVRIFGSAPGSYGTGLQALVDGDAWAEEGELALGYLAIARRQRPCVRDDRAEVEFAQPAEVEVRHEREERRAVPGHAVP